MSQSTLIFDFDGTLVDSLAIFVEIYNEIAPRYGCRPVGTEELAVVRAKSSLKELMQTHGIKGWKLPFILLSIRHRLKTRLKEATLQPGIVDALNALNQQGVRLGILTSNSQTLTRKFLAQQGLLDLFAFVHGSYDLFGKDLALRKLMRAYHLDPATTSYVGDESRDIEAAKKAEIQAIAVTWGFQPKSAFAKSHPDRLIDRPEELQKLTA